MTLCTMKMQLQNKPTIYTLKAHSMFATRDELCLHGYAYAALMLSASSGC